jgi:hypothetical protein
MSKSIKLLGTIFIELKLWRRTGKLKEILDVPLFTSLKFNSTKSRPKQMLGLIIQAFLKLNCIRVSLFGTSSL